MIRFAIDNAVLIGALGCLFVGPGLVIALLLRRRRLRAGRPIGSELLRPPGFTRLARIDAAASALTRDGLILSAIPLMGFAIYLAHAALLGWPGTRPLTWIYAFAVVAISAWRLRKLIETADRLDRLRIGLDAELAVGQELDQLMRSGAVVFHDFPADGFRIDHIVIAVEGVYAVETQGIATPAQPAGHAPATVAFDGHTLQFPGWSTEEPLLRAERQAKWLSRWMTSTLGQMVLVTPVLALPGWVVRFTGRSTVRVYGGRALHTLLGARSRQPLSEHDVQHIAHQVAQRCRAGESPEQFSETLPAALPPRRRRAVHS